MFGKGYKMKYALIDWDKTLRKDYTLFCWMDYLTENNIISKKYNINVKNLFDKYTAGNLTHEQLAEFACLEYSKSITNIDKQFLISISKEYLYTDKLHMYSFTPKLFDLLNKNNILPIIVSGAPLIIISHYFQDFKIKKVYAFDNDTLKGRYTGKIKYNYGYNKINIVKKIQKEMQNSPLLSIGDSESDFPMLNVAQYGFIINKQIKNKNYISVNEKNILENIQNILEKQ